MGAMVLLLHELPDGSAHFDWMLQRPDESPGLLTFRLNTRHLPIAPGRPASFPAERLPDHRKMYLDYTGPVGGPLAAGVPADRGHIRPGGAGVPPVAHGIPADRGFVRPLRSGTCTILTETPDLIELVAYFDGDAPLRWTARPAPIPAGRQPPVCPVWHFSLGTPG